MAAILHASQYIFNLVDFLTVLSGQIIGWTGLVRVDNETYTWMGAPKGIPVANQTAYEYTATKSIFTIEVNDKVALNITFLSPVTPEDLKRQSLVFSYMNVEVSSLDGGEHQVQIYTDVSAGTQTHLPKSLMKVLKSA
jgi:hypothetical protein